ncbi:MAG: hypothetical protein ABSB76_18515, partial [Streptosporangiaceae bacterium]
HAAGYEVRVITDAVVYHRELATRQVRKTPATGGHPRLLDRRSALYVFAVNLPLWPMLAVVGGCIAGSLARAAYFLVTKQQRKAAAHLGAVAWLLRHPILIWRARARRAGHRKAGYAVLRPQLPRARTLARLAERTSGLLSRRSGYETGGLHQAVVTDPDDDMPFVPADSVIRRVLTSPGVLLFAGLTVVALVAERSLTGSVFSGSGTLSGGVLGPAWGGAGDLWREYLAGYHDAGIGSTASTPPYIGLVAALATVLGGKPWLAVDVLLLGCVPAAGVTAFLATRRVTSALAARVWLAATYALLPVAMGAVAAGRIGTVVAFVLLPLVAVMTGRMLTGAPRAARRAAWAAGLLVAIAAAFVPLAWLIAAVAAIGAALAWHWLGPRTVVNALIVAVVPAVILIPWTFHLVTSPSALFAEAGLPRPGLAVAGLRPAPLLLLSPGGPGLPPVWVTAGLVLPAFGALLIRRRRTLVYAGWGVALAGLVIALVVSRVRVMPPTGDPAVSAWPGMAIAVAAAGLLLAAVPLIEAAGRPLRGAADLIGGRLPRTDWRVLATLAAFAVALSAPVLAAGYWLADGVGGTVSAAGSQVLPAFVAASATGPDRNRTLVLRPGGGGLSYTVLRDADPVLGEPELAEAASSARALSGVVASLVAAGSGDAGDTGQALSQFDIGYVLLPAPVDQALAQQLDAAAGLQPLSQAPAYDLWQVSGPVARAWAVTAAGTTVPVPSGSIGVNAVVGPATSGTLVLAEAAGGWSATLNGKPLRTVSEPVDGWAQGFVLPAGGGRLVITRDETARDISLGVEAAALLVAFALALPGTRASVAAPAGAESGESARSGRREHASGPRAARRRRRPQLALAGVKARGVPRARRADDAGAGHAIPAGSGSHAATFSPAVPALSSAADAFSSTPDAFSSTPDAFLSSAPGTAFGSAPEVPLHPEVSLHPEAPLPGSSLGSDPAFGSAADADYSRVVIASGPAAPVSAVHPPEYGAAPAASPARRGHGQHAARHGKPSRRWRGSAAGKPPGSPPGKPPGSPPPQIPDPQIPDPQIPDPQIPDPQSLASQSPPPQILASPAEGPPRDAEAPEPLGSESRAPWERGDS